MRKRIIFMLVFAILGSLIVTAASVSAQDIDVDSMDNEQLTTLLLQILNKLQTEDQTEETVPTEIPAPETDPSADGSAAETVTGEPTQEDTASPTAVPAADPEEVEEVFQITIYENKKLIIQQLPDYMFYQKEEKQEEEPGPSKPKCPAGQQWVCDIYGRCYCTSAKG